MHFSFPNVNGAFQFLIDELQVGGVPTVSSVSRVGQVNYIQEPVIITYRNPRERVLCYPERDANPFFHLYESLWMLAGRCDVAPLSRYCSTIKDIASDDGYTFNGAYGYRWRNSRFGSRETKVDQLVEIVNELSGNSASRRAVLQMWMVDQDLLKISKSKDVCCNLCACFAIRFDKKVCRKDHRAADCDCCEKGHEPVAYLDMTVFNRSNDLVLGCLGANVVHFSMLQEYLACLLSLEVGVYNQVTNNLHYYHSNWEPDKWLAISPEDYPGAGPKLLSIDDGETQKSFDDKVKAFTSDIIIDPWTTGPYGNLFLDTVVIPLMRAFECHKQRDYEQAAEQLFKVAAPDWYYAASNWILKRMRAWNGKKYAGKVLEENYNAATDDRNPYLVSHLRSVEEQLTNRKFQSA